MDTKTTHKRQLTGTVVQNRMNKTVVVRVDTIKIHPKYHKRYRSSKKFHAHTNQSLQLGVLVRIEECRPMSKLKRWKVVELTDKNLKNS
jgi:small subunit ribosomal protein S17